MTLLHPAWVLPALVFLVAFALVRMHPDDNWRDVMHVSVLRFLQKKSATQGPSHQGARRPELLVAAIACLALSSPAVLSDNIATYRYSQGWIILADVSRSMTIDDVAPSRLSAMRNAALALSRRAGASSTTLIIYAGDAFIVSPPSFDHSTIEQNILLLDHGIVPLEGSSLTRALSLALSVIQDSQLVNARLFVLSDTGGMNNRSDAVVSRLASLGHQTDAIIFGEASADSSAPFDEAMAKSLVDSGKGRLVLADSLGQVNLETLDLEANLSDNRWLSSTGLSSIRWQNQSHWLLLLVVPIFLQLFDRHWHR